jgi:hypothetical protein
MNAAVDYLKSEIEQRERCVTEDAAPLFHSAFQALRFAVTRIGGASRPIMNRMTDKNIAESGLGGLDGAAQAGIIMSVIHPLGRVAEAALIASCAPHSLPCACRKACCSGRTFNHIWNQAVNSLCQDAAVYLLPGTGKRAHVVVTERASSLTKQFRDEDIPEGRFEPGIKLGAILKIYGAKLTIVNIAESGGADADMVGRLHLAMHRWLKGAPRGKGGDAVVGVEPEAWAGAETALRHARIVG